MKKKIGLLVTAGAMSALLVVGSTLAWFTDDKAATNTFTMGNVAIDLLENGEQAPTNTFNDESFTGLLFENVVPGDILDKKVTVKNVGSVNSYVRVKLTAALKDSDASVLTKESFAKTKIEDLIAYTIDDENFTDYNTTNWFLATDGFYYYKGVLPSIGDAQTTQALFSEVTLPGSKWGNEMANQNFTIKVEVEAIQADNIYEVKAGETFAVETLVSKWTSAVAQ